MSYTKLYTGVDHAKSYAKYRPTYPAEVYQQFLHFMRCHDDRPKYDVAIDVGCGSGQSTKPLAPYFTQVIGIDPSQSQIEEGNKRMENANITLQVGVGEQLPCDPCSVDLVACGQSFHWFDKNKFWAEVDRVLKPGTGCLALYGYGLIHITNNDQVHQIFNEFFHDIFGARWSDMISQVENLYHQVTLPYSDQIRIDSISINGKMSLDDLIGYASSWIGYREYMEKNSDDPLPNIKARMAGALQQASANDIIEYRFPIFILIGRKPSVNNG